MKPAGILTLSGPGVKRKEDWYHMEMVSHNMKAITVTKTRANARSISAFSSRQPRSGPLHQIAGVGVKEKRVPRKEIDRALEYRAKFERDPDQHTHEEA